MLLPALAPTSDPLVYLHLPMPQVIIVQGARCTATRLRAMSGAPVSLAGSPRAAILIIGDEVLSGAIQDTNAAWLAKLLHSRGCDMMRFECVPDSVPAIVDALQRMQTVVGADGAVFTSGAPWSGCGRRLSVQSPNTACRLTPSETNQTPQIPLV